MAPSSVERREPAVRSRSTDESSGWGAWLGGGRPSFRGCRAGRSYGGSGRVRVSRLRGSARLRAAGGCHWFGGFWFGGFWFGGFWFGGFWFGGFWFGGFWFGGFWFGATGSAVCGHCGV